MIDNSWPTCTGNADGIEPLNCHIHRLVEKNNQFRAGRRLETSHTCPASPRTVVQLSRSAPLPRLPRSRTGSLCSVLHFGLLLHCCLLCCSSRWRCLRQAGVCSCRLSDGDVPQYCSALAPRHQCAFFRALSVGPLRARLWFGNVLTLADHVRVTNCFMIWYEMIWWYDDVPYLLFPQYLND